MQEEIVTQSVPVILITSLSDVTHEQRGLIMGAVDYITKPFNAAIVKARVNTHVKLYRYRRQAEQQSMTDQLTGIANRRRYESYSRKKWKEAIRLGAPFSIFMFDIDRFKVYNDTFGHPAGDKVITAVAQTAASHLQRSTDFFARYGGEEFVAFSLGDSAGQIFGHLKKIRLASGRGTGIQPAQRRAASGFDYMGGHSSHSHRRGILHIVQPLMHGGIESEGLASGQVKTIRAPRHRLKSPRCTHALCRIDAHTYLRLCGKSPDKTFEIRTERSNRRNKLRL